MTSSDLGQVSSWRGKKNSLWSLLKFENLNHSKNILSSHSILNFTLFFKLTYNVILVSGVQCNDSILVYTVKSPHSKSS